MPRYCYKCENCASEATIFHLIDETVDECLACRSRDTMIKQLTKPLYRTKTEDRAQEVGTITKEYIDLNREILNEEKKKREDYDPT